jgi:preprotein translocase subunit SecD
MLSSLRNRLITIAVLIVVSIIYLLPRSETIRQRGPDGSMVDITEKRVPINYGLDLQGGMHLALALDESQKVSTNPARDIDLALTVLRKRIDEFGVTEPLIQKVGSDRIVVELAGITDPARAESIVEQNAFLEFRLTDKTGALESALPAMDRALARLGIKGGSGKPTDTGIESLLKSDSGKGKSDSAKAQADSAASNTILQDLIRPSAGTGLGMPGEYVVPETAAARVDSLLKIPDVARQLPRGLELKWARVPEALGTEQVRYLYALEEKPIITGQNLVDANAEIDPLTQKRVVTFELDRAGARVFGQQTARHINDYMAIVLDGRVEGRPPVIQSRIDRRGQIELTGRTLQEAQDLALTLKAGALPVPLKIVERRVVGASLGADSIRDGLTAGLVGTALVILIMIGYYRLAGVLAVVALALYILFTVAGLAAVHATLTLPGLAGLVLSVGIAVDANVLIFERIREELIAGRTVRLAVDEGFKHAMNAIVDSNVSTVLTALFLFQFGTGPVKGFAVTLTMGIAASMITAVFVTRTFFILWLERRPSATTLSI